MKWDLPVLGCTIVVNDGAVSSDLHDPQEGPVVRAAVDAIESMVLAHAMAGVDVGGSPYLAGLETAVEAVFNHA